MGILQPVSSEQR
uniref:Uncharacterized protein n=1 Tax=Arundo donax TaxID=35708 RepID=A0A0A8YCI2_ARUDO